MKRYKYIKGIVEVFNAIDTEDVVYTTAPDPIEHPVNLIVDAIGKALGLNHGTIRQDLPIRIIGTDAYPIDGEEWKGFEMEI